jgi:hypothetical protein
MQNMLPKQTTPNTVKPLGKGSALHVESFAVAVPEEKRLAIIELLHNRSPNFTFLQWTVCRSDAVPF